MGFLLLRGLVQPRLPLFRGETVPAGRYDLAQATMICLDRRADPVPLAHLTTEDDESVSGAADVGLWATSTARRSVWRFARTIGGRHRRQKLVIIIERGIEGRWGGRIRRQ